MSRKTILRRLSVAAACFAVVAGWNSACSNQSADKSIGTAVEPKANDEATKTLGGSDRFQTFISTDKPIYKAGEKVYVRGVLLSADKHKPLKSENSNATIEIKGPKGDVVAGGTATSQDSVWGFAWEVPQGQAGGEYTVHVSYPWNGHAPAERKFDIRAYRAPRLKSQITFMRDGYGPGDKVTATLDVKRAEGGVPAGANVTVNARVDGIELKAAPAKVGADGLCSVSFDLPREIEKGEGTLALVIEDGGVVETASKTIPILLQTVDLKIFPEGGDLVAGYKNRVYIQAKQPNGKPADLAGTLSIGENGGAGITSFKTEHEGRGRFEFTPELNKEYYLSISQPAGIKTKFKLPSVKGSGAIIRSDREVFEKDKPLNLRIGCTEKAYRVAISKCERELAAHKVADNNLSAGELNFISFKLPPDADGVLTVTVFDKNDKPIAERLVFREAAKALKISITPDKKNYVPGDKANIKVKATEADGKPVSAVVGLTVTDDSVLEMIDKREQAPHLPVMVFLEPEVDDLADAHVYMDKENPKAALATDLLLGTQGWRRYASMNLAQFIEAQGDKARRVLALKIQSQYEMEESMALAAPKGVAVRALAMFEGGPVPPNAAPRPMAAPVPMPVAAAMPKMKAAGAMPQRAQAAADGDVAVMDFRQAANMPINKDMADGEVMGKLQNAIRAAGTAEKRRRIAFGGGRGEGFAADEIMPIGQGMNNLILVREYAHPLRENRKAGDRVDFSETLYWNAGVKTDAGTGEASISFDLSDSVSTFKIFADAFGDSGAVAGTSASIEAVQPFYAEAKLPLEVTSGDKILLPVNLVNATESNLSGSNVEVALNGDFKLSPITKASSELAAGQRQRWIQAINVGAVNGSKDFILNAQSGPYSDKVTRTLNVKPKGFPIEVPFGGMLEAGKPVEHTIRIPANVIQESLASNNAVYPTPLANMTEAMERLIQDPYGCFEQTSSTSYPLTMAQQYFVSHTGIDPKLVERSREKLDAGYKKLVGFWCPDRGYEWFGENPGHEALTAFGLMHFTDMSQVREVDQNMVNSTRAWLMKQKDGKGGFTRKRRALHTWIEDKDCSNAYILWSLLESGQSAQDLKPELVSLKSAGAASSNSYVTALAANALYLGGDKAEAKTLMDKLAAKQKADGSVAGISASIVGSGGEALDIEGTSLATLAWLRDPAYAANVEKSIKFLADSCKAGRYGSTQSTVLALRAIVTYDKMRARPKAPGKVRIFVDGQPVGDWRDFTPTTQGAIKLPDISELMSPGEHKIKLVMEGGGPMPYSVAVKYNALTPDSSKDCKLDLQVKLAEDKVTEGNSTEAKVTVTNKTKDVLPTPVAIVGLPGGLEPRHDQLKELVKKGSIDAYEVLGREVVLYWRTLPAEAKIELPISLIAAIPGSYTGPASRAYLYYTDEHKLWIDGAHVEIAAK